MSKEKTKIHLKGVRISFPSLHKKELYKGVETEKYAATFLIPKSNKEAKKQIDIAMNKMLAENKVSKLPSDKICLKDGDESDQEAYHGYWTLKAANKKKPNVFNKEGQQILENDDIEDLLYSGCYVYAIIDLWFMKNDYGKRILANLYGVKFLKDGEPLSSNSGPIDVSDEFDDIDESEFDDL